MAMRLKFARTFRLLRKIKISKKSIRIIFKLPAFNYKNALYFFNILKSNELIKLLFNLFHVAMKRVKFKSRRYLKRFYLSIL